jgi:predicted RNase H-like HicB family nuclease
MSQILNKIIRFFYPSNDPILVKRQYGLPETINLTVRFQDGWLVATSSELPGLITQAKDQQELIEMVNDAVLTYFDVPKRTADVVYNTFNIGNQVIQYEGQLQTRTT